VPKPRFNPSTSRVQLYCVTATPTRSAAQLQTDRFMHDDLRYRDRQCCQQSNYYCSCALWMSPLMLNFKRESDFSTGRYAHRMPTIVRVYSLVQYLLERRDAREERGSPRRLWKEWGKGVPEQGTSPVKPETVHNRKIASKSVRCTSCLASVSLYSAGEYILSLSVVIIPVAITSPLHHLTVEL
jgi:hypothetical protein